MPMIPYWRQLLAGVAVLMLLLSTLFLLRQPRLVVAPRAQNQPVTLAKVAQAPLPDSPLPTAIVEGTIYPTLTPLPTFTPRATLEFKPDPTLTPYPTHVPRSDASGVIFYTVESDSQRSLRYLTVDAQGQRVGNDKPFALDFSPTLGSTSPDGHYLILLKPVFPVSIPYVVDTQTQRIWPLFKDNPMQEQITGIELGWHPDSRQLLFWFFGNEELWLVDVETAHYKVLAYTYGPPQGAAISPNGQHIIYGNRSEGANEAIWVVDSAGSEAQRLLDSQMNLYIFDWSPDGKYILYMGESSGELKSQDNSSTNVLSPLKVISLDSQDPKRLLGPFLSGWGFEPSWSPDSQWITYTGLGQGHAFGCAQQERISDWQKCQFEGTWVYAENVSTGQVTQIAPGIDPLWSPDGSMIAFASNQNGMQEIWTVRTTDGLMQQLTQSANPVSTFLWNSGEE